VNFKQPRQHNKVHLAFIRDLPCLICKDNISTEAAHIRYSDAAYDKANPGSHKPDDKHTVPLCGDCHRDQHRMGERDYWNLLGIDPLLIARQLYAVSGDHEEGCRIVEKA